MVQGRGAGRTRISFYLFMFFNLFKVDLGPKTLVFHWFYKVYFTSKVQKPRFGTPGNLDCSLVFEVFDHKLLVPSFKNGETPPKIHEKSSFFGEPKRGFWALLFE